MKIVIMCGGFYEQWETPKQLQIVNGERIVERTIRLLKKNGCKDIVITSNNPAFDELGVPRLEHENSYRYENGKLNGYWLDAFYPKFRKNQKATFIFGDVYFTEEAIKAIVNCDSPGNILFGSKGALTVGKVWGEPYAYIVNDMASFYDGIAAVKKLQDEGITNRVPIVWELYRYLNGIDVNTHLVKEETYKVIDDGTDDCDYDYKLKRLKDRFEIKGNVFCVHSLNEIGGGESFLYYMAKEYADLDITIYYVDPNSNKAQIERLEQYAKVERHTGQKIRCKKAFFNYNLACIKDVEAEEYYQVIHCNYKTNNLTPKATDKPIQFISVSKHAAEAFKEQTGLDSKVIYNPFVKAEKAEARLTPIKLMSATRLTKGKGKERTEKLANILEAAGVNFVWYVYTNDKSKINNDHIVYEKPRLDLCEKYMPDCDWFVQLSDDEAYGYSVAEANSVGVPCITTPCPAFKEIGIQGIVVDYDLSDVPIDIIKKGMKIKAYTPPKDEWRAVLADVKSDYTPPKDTDELVIRIKRKYKDLTLNRFVEAGEELTVTRARLKVLDKCGVDFDIVR